jgi:hypothetical protein
MESDGALPGNVQDLARVRARTELIGRVQRNRGRPHTRRRGSHLDHRGRCGHAARAVTRTLRSVAARRAIAAATVLPAVFLARRPADEIEDPTCLQQREDKQQHARNAHAS